MASASRHVRLVLIALLLVGFIVLVVNVRAMLAPFFLAAALAYVLHPIVNYLEGRAVPRSVGILILYIAAAVLVWTAGKLVLPHLTREIHELADSLPRQTERLEGLTRRTVQDVRNVQLPATLDDMLQTVIDRIERLLEAFAARIGDLLFRLMGGVFSLVLAPVLAFYLLRDWMEIRAKALRALPIRWRRHALQLGRRINGLLHGYIRGQFLVSAIVGGLATLGLALFEVPYAVVIGLLAGLFDIIPYFGPVIGTVPGVALALMESPQKALYVLFMFIGIQQVESSVLSPKIVGDSVGLHPLTVIGVVLTGAELFGILGMVISVPLAAILKVVCLYFFNEPGGASQEPDVP